MKNHPITEHPHQLLVADIVGFFHLWKAMPLTEEFIDPKLDAAPAAQATVASLVNMVNATNLYEVSDQNIVHYRKNAYKNMLAVQIVLQLDEGTQRVLLYIPADQDEIRPVL